MAFRNRLNGSPERRASFYKSKSFIMKKSTFNLNGDFFQVYQILKNYEVYNGKEKTDIWTFYRSVENPVSIAKQLVTGYNSGSFFVLKKKVNVISDSEFRRLQGLAKLLPMPPFREMCILLKKYNIFLNGEPIDKWEYYYHVRKNPVESAQTLIYEKNIGLFSIKPKNEKSGKKRKAA